jgi:hypothetical protein
MKELTTTAALAILSLLLRTAIARLGLIERATLCKILFNKLRLLKLLE